MKKYIFKYWIVISVVAVVVVTEATLRLALGLGKPVLSQADSDTGYRFQPNQKIYRFGKNIEYNQYSQRSEPITIEKPRGKLRILMVGDSVLNGGNFIDQSQIISELFEKKLTASAHPAEVLNASAGSWGIGNRLGYLRKFGTFDSDAVILQIGTHDLLQPTSTGEKIGFSSNFPNHPPLLAIEELFTRYGLPKLLKIFRIRSRATEILQLGDTNSVFQQNMDSLKAMIEIIRSQNTPVFVLFTPNRNELLYRPEIPQYKSRFIKLLNSLEVPIIDAHANWGKNTDESIKNYFIDRMHLTVKGNQATTNLLFEKLCVEQELSACSTTKL